MSRLQKTEWILPVLLFLLMFVLQTAPSEAGNIRHIILLPTVNYTDYEIWESKFYPVNVLEQKITEHLAALLRKNPFTDVFTLDEAQAEAWLQNSHGRRGDFAVQMELYSVLAKEREALGTFEKGDVSLRVRIYSDGYADVPTSYIASGKDQRYTFNPGDDRLYFLNALGLTVFHKDGLDLLRLTPPDKGQKMSRLTWQQFSSTSYWQAFKNAIANVAVGITDMGGGELAIIGRIIAPTAHSTKQAREYIITLGRRHALVVGDILQVVRSDTYVTVDPENPVVILPRVVGNVKVTKVMESEAVVRLINERSNDPVQLNDLVTTSPYGTKKVAPLR